MWMVIALMWSFVAAQIFFEYRHHIGHTGPYMGITKTAGSLCFVAIGVLAEVHSTTGGTFLLGGLILCVAGDIFLISQKRLFFLLGLVSFLLGHMVYAAGFVLRGGSWSLSAIAAPIVAIAGFFIGKWLLPHVEEKMKIPVIAYIVAICAMVILSAQTIAGSGPGLVVAAVLFMVSDVFVAKDRFIHCTFSNRLFGLPLYYGGQLVFATAHLLFF